MAEFEALLPGMDRVLGPDHPDTLTTRHNTADWRGQTGDARGALGERTFACLSSDRLYQRVYVSWTASSA